MTASTHTNETASRQQMEVHKIRRSHAYFTDTYCFVLSDEGNSEEWIPFTLWPSQFQVSKLLQANRLVICLKARQLGLTWLALSFALWLVLFHPIATVLLFSRRDDEAVDLLSVRLRGMYDRLPAWLKVQSSPVSNDHEWRLSNGSRVLAFPTTAGDSYTATLAIVDEADLSPDLGKLMRAVKPTIDGGGRMLLLSRSDKSKPASVFKKIYQGAKAKATEWVSVFLPWHARPDRDAAWYAKQKADIWHRTGSLDDLHEQYPDTDLEALMARTLDKRIAPAWLQQCYKEVPALIPDKQWEHHPPAIPGLTIYRLPRKVVERGDRDHALEKFVIGGDPAEGNPTSDDSALTVLDVATGEEVAALAGKFQPAVFAAHIDAVGRFYNNAALMIERNNHGHAVLLWLRDNSKLTKLSGHDGNTGWLSSSKGKSLLYDAAADAFREGETTIHSHATLMQLASIEGATLLAPEGEHEDRADSYALAVVGLRQKQRAAAGAQGAVPRVMQFGRKSE